LVALDVDAVLAELADLLGQVEERTDLELVLAAHELESRRGVAAGLRRRRREALVEPEAERLEPRQQLLELALVGEGRDLDVGALTLAQGVGAPPHLELGGLRHRLLEPARELLLGVD